MQMPLLISKNRSRLRARSACSSNCYGQPTNARSTRRLPRWRKTRRARSSSRPMRISPVDAIRSPNSEHVLARYSGLMHETMAVGRAAGAEFPPDFPAELERSVAGFPPMMKASMANDLHAGNRLELDWLAGKVIALGRKYGIPTPAQEAVYAILKPYRTGQ